MRTACYNVIGEKHRKEAGAMEQNNNTIKEKAGKHLSYEERQKLEILLKAKVSVKEIARLLGGRSERTIKREINRGTVKLLDTYLNERYEYSADAGQLKYDRNAANKGRGLKIGSAHDLVSYIEKKIGEEKMSPYAALQSIENEGKEFAVSISLKTLYNYIEQGLFLNISQKDLPQRGKKRTRNYNKIRRAHNNPTGTSIIERPEEIEYRRDFGHWELDTVVGKAGTKAALLVLTERMTRYELIFKLENKTEKAVVDVLDILERKLGQKRFCMGFKTITCDNGCENLDHVGMERSITKGKRTKVYYAHPYSAWERGSNENANKLIRRFVPKGTDIGRLTHREVKRIERWMNEYPRAILGGHSAKMAVLALGQEPIGA